MKAEPQPDMLAALAPPGPPPVEISPDVPALRAIALACAHYHRLTFPHRDTPADSWFEAYAASQGLRQARLMIVALDRIPAEHRAALAAHLARAPA